MPQVLQLISLKRLPEHLTRIPSHEAITILFWMRQRRQGGHGAGERRGQG